MAVTEAPVTLTQAQLEEYRRDGYLVYPHLFSRERAGQSLQRLEDLVLERIPRPAGIRIQVEPAIQRGEVSAQPSPLDAIRKVECLVANDPVYSILARDPALLGVLTGILGPDIKMFRDALMMKPARHGSAKPYHQDSAYWAVDPPDLCSVWLALDEATVENGCMRVLPGSHRWGMLEHKHLQDFQVEEEALDRSREVAVPLPPGGALFFHSLLLHATSPNDSDRPRRAMILSYMSARSRYTQDPAGKPDYLLIQGREHPGCV